MNGLKKDISKLEFVNHASLKINIGEICLLSDPWFFGDAFDKSWKLLVDTSDEDIERLLASTTHIWLSHEHPDHFSIPFFLRFKERLISRKITILFQKTVDKRVQGFLGKLGLSVIELDDNQPFNLSDDMQVTLHRDGFYDSALLVECADLRILNVNDCNITTESKALALKNRVGAIDVLATQFSYAAWKGGRDNIEWRRRAAKEKLDTVILQTKVFSPSILIPFASYSYFCHKDNFYLNDSSNSPRRIFDALQGSKTRVAVMKPRDVLRTDFDEQESLSAISYWEGKRESLDLENCNEAEPVGLNELTSVFESIYMPRIIANNNFLLIRLISIFGFFGTVRIFLTDIQETVEISLLKKRITKIANQTPDVSLSSSSLLFLLKNSFGLDTLTVNGRFEEVKPRGFSRLAKSLAIENLNNMGLSVRFRSIPALVSTGFEFLVRLRKAKANLRT